MPWFDEADRDQPAVGTELARDLWAFTAPLARERERTPDAPGFGEVPSDGGSVGADRVQRRAVGGEDELTNGVGVTVQGAAARRRFAIQQGHGPVATRRHEGSAVRAEPQQLRALGKAGGDGHGAAADIYQLDAVVDADGHGATVRPERQHPLAGGDVERPDRLPGQHVPPRQLTGVRRGDDRPAVGREREVGRLMDIRQRDGVADPIQRDRVVDADRLSAADDDVGPVVREGHVPRFVAEDELGQLHGVYADR